MNLTYSVLLRRALIAGLVAGAIVAVFLVIVVEPTIGDAIALEDAQAALEPVMAGAGHAAEEPLFTRTAQTIGGAAALIIFCVTLSVIFATVYASIRHRIRASSELTRVLKVAAIGFSCVALFPWLAHPANPPAVGNPDTVNQRTMQYVAALAFAILAAVLIGRFSSWLRRRTDEPNRIVLVAAAILVVYGGALVVLPATPDAIAPIVPADLIWQFRLRSIGTLALVWATFGLAYGWLLQRAYERSAPVPATDAGVPASA